MPVPVYHKADVPPMPLEPARTKPLPGLASAHLMLEAAPTFRRTTPPGLVFAEPRRTAQEPPQKVMSPPQYADFDPERFIGKAGVLDSITALCRTYRATRGRNPSILVAIGGTAMSLHGLRDQSSDVDIFSTDRDIARIGQMTQAFIDDEPVTIDITSDRHLWGEIDVFDIDDDATLVNIVEIDGDQVEIRAISPETLLILKAMAGRDKDKADIEILRERVAPAMALSRVATLWEHNATSTMTECLDRVLDVFADQNQFEIEPGWFADVPWPVLSQWEGALEEKTGGTELWQRVLRANSPEPVTPARRHRIAPAPSGRKDGRS